jgi:hypothetical protein
LFEQSKPDASVLRMCDIFSVIVHAKTPPLDKTNVALQKRVLLLLKATLGRCEYTLLCDRRTLIWSDVAKIPKCWKYELLKFLPDILAIKDTSLRREVLDVLSELHTHGMCFVVASCLPGVIDRI